MDEKIEKIIRDLDDQTKRILAQVIELERDHLHMQRPHLNSDIARIISSEVKE